MSTDTPSLPLGTAELLSAHPTITRQLPAPDERWTRHEAPPEVQSMLDRLREADVILTVERRGNEHPNIYRTHPAAETHIIRQRRATQTPCGHTGVRNLGDGAYTCSFEGCEATFDRDRAEEVLSG